MRVVMSDWAADLYISSNPISALYDVLLLSLLYDEILIPDETLVLSSRLAEWFCRPEYFALLEKVFQVGSVIVLKHPLKDYGEERLQEKAEESPILARADYISQIGTRADRHFKPSRTQKSFYKKLEALLNGRWQREVGAKPGLPRSMRIMEAFTRTLRSVLSESGYRTWIKSAFKPADDRILDDFLVYIERPERAVERIVEHGGDDSRVIRKDGVPVFNRSLAYQLAATYGRRETAMRRLIQSAFYAPFCNNENAAGRYSRFLRELLILPEGGVTADESREPIVGVGVDTQSLGLPELTTPFVDAFREVRESKDGARLRRSMTTLGKEVAFQSQVESWRAVADLLTRKLARQRQFKILPAAIQVGGRVILGVIAGALYSQVNRAELPNVLDSVTISALGGTMGLACGHVYAMICSDFQEQRLRPQLEGAVKFRCTEIPLAGRFLS